MPTIPYIHYFVYLMLLTLTAGIGLARWNIISRPDRWMVVLISVTTIQETIAFIMAALYSNNIITYHIYSPIELIITGMFLTEFRPPGRWRRTVRISIVTGAIAADILNICFLQSLEQFATNYLLLESTVIIILCLTYLYQMVLDVPGYQYKSPGFWFVICLLFYWSITFYCWGSFPMVNISDPASYAMILMRIENAANYSFYIGVATILFSYKSLRVAVK